MTDERSVLTQLAKDLRAPAELERRLRSGFVRTVALAAIFFVLALMFLFMDRLPAISPFLGVMAGFLAAQALTLRIMARAAPVVLPHVNRVSVEARLQELERSAGPIAAGHP